MFTVRVLFSFISGNGHFQPLVPIARAVESAGHTIVFACSSRRQSLPESETFPTLLLDEPKASKTTPEMTPLRPLSVAREESELRESFARRGAQKRVPGMITACQMWKPDIIVCDEVDFGTMIAAEYLDIPHATVVVIASGSFIRPDVVAEPLNELRREYDLPEDYNPDMLSRYLVFNPTPPSFRDPKFPLPPTAQLIYPFEKQDVSSPLPIAEYDNSLPTIYFTLGTVFNIESGDLFSRVLVGLSDVEANIIVTVGKQINPEMFGPQPDKILITQYIPQTELLPQL
ncbi:MAG: glycosyltransferase [Chloroflexota bacterium]